jgi:hypothetical protein
VPPGGTIESISSAYPLPGTKMEKGSILEV